MGRERGNEEEKEEEEQGTGAHVVKPWGLGAGDGTRKIDCDGTDEGKSAPRGSPTRRWSEVPLSLARSLARSCAPGGGDSRDSLTARYSKANGAKVMKRNPVVSMSYGRAFETYL